MAQSSSNGAIGYTEYAWALEEGFPVAKLLNAAVYYTLPSPGHVAVSLLADQVNTSNPSDPTTYLTQNLSGVYTNTDPRNYELSAYSYFILPTSLSGIRHDDRQGLHDRRVRQLRALPRPVAGGRARLLRAAHQPGASRLRAVAEGPGSTVPTESTAAIAQCNNPTFSTNGTNTLAENDPQPLALRQAGHHPVRGGGSGADRNRGADRQQRGGQRDDGRRHDEHRHQFDRRRRSTLAPGYRRDAGRRTSGRREASAGGADQRRGSTGATGTVYQSARPGRPGPPAPGRPVTRTPESAPRPRVTGSTGSRRRHRHARPRTGSRVPASRRATPRSRSRAATAAALEVTLMALAAGMLFLVSVVPPLLAQAGRRSGSGAGSTSSTRTTTGRENRR